jgi:Cu/Ag efflux pump CusA
LPANMPLNVTLVIAGVIGVVVSPLLMAWWLRTLKRQADAVVKAAAAVES